MRKPRGFTLLEFIVVSALMLVMSGLVLYVSLHLSDFWQTASTQLDLRSEAQLAMQRMVQELRNATRAAPGGGPPNLSIPAPPANDRVQFYLPEDLDGNGLIVTTSGTTEWPTGAPIQYQYVPGQQLLRRLEGAVQTTILNDVMSVVFDDQSTDPALYADEVRIQVTLQRTTPQQRVLTVNASSIVKLRN